MVYALFPQCNISIHVMWGVQRQNTVLACGTSILDRGSRTNVGELMLNYGGGGHLAAGTCQVDNDRADATRKKLIKKINAAGQAPVGLGASTRSRSAAEPKAVPARTVFVGFAGSSPASRRRIASMPPELQ